MEWREGQRPQAGKFMHILCSEACKCGLVPRIVAHLQGWGRSCRRAWQFQIPTTSHKLRCQSSTGPSHLFARGRENCGSNKLGRISTVVYPVSKILNEATSSKCMAMKAMQLASQTGSGEVTDIQRIVNLRPCRCYSPCAECRLTPRRLRTFQRKYLAQLPALHMHPRRKKVLRKRGFAIVSPRS